MVVADEDQPRVDAVCLVEARRWRQRRLIEETAGRFAAEAAQRLGRRQAACVQLALARTDDDAALQQAFDDLSFPLVTALQDGLDERTAVELPGGNALALALLRPGGAVI